MIKYDLIVGRDDFTRRASEPTFDSEVPIYSLEKIVGKNMHWLSQGVSDIMGLTVASTKFIKFSRRRRGPIAYSSTVDEYLAG